MASFDLIIDTDPMAQKIDSVNGNVRTVTGAVIAMQSAVISQERETARQICANVDNGFYILMKSQLSQKIAACSSIMSGKLLLMKKFRDDIGRIKEIMQEDYNRICRRYKKQFTALDKALGSRINELDRSAMQIAHIQKKHFEIQRDEVGTVICCGVDTQLTAVKSSGAVVKSKTLKALNVLADSAGGGITYNRKVAHILKNETPEIKTDKFIPVMFIENESMLNAGQTVSNVYIPEYSDTKTNDRIANEVRGKMQKVEWKKISDREKEEIKNHFMKQISEGLITERVSNEMLRLLNVSDWEAPLTGGTT